MPIAKIKQIKKCVRNDADFVKGDTFQALMNLGYDEWQKKERWEYKDMINFVERKYGDLVKFAILVGKLNQQVRDAGFSNYYYNMYMGPINEPLKFHRDLVNLIKKLELDKSAIGQKILNIFNSLEIEMYQDDSLTEKCINNLYKLDEEYYKFSDEWMTYLDWFFDEFIETEKKPRIGYDKTIMFDLQGYKVIVPKKDVKKRLEQGWKRVI